MDNREGIQPESMKPQPGASTNVPENAPHPDAPQIDPPNMDEMEEPAAFLSPTNIVMLGLMLLAAIYLYLKFDPTIIQVWFIIKAALGLSFIIFIHELGHFLAAKWCNVHVTTFSIGFGPSIPGCFFRWGETTYKLGILPLGGYVQMVGQVDGDEAADDNEDPRSYRRKTVIQRMLIISAGVIMNAILAAVCFVYVYQGPGKEHPAANIGSLDSEGPAYLAGLHSSARITKIGSVDDPHFTDLMQNVINTMPGEQIPIAFQRPGGEVQEITIEPRKTGSDNRPVIGVLTSSRLIFPQKRGEEGEGPFFHGTPAADSGFEYGDKIIAMTDPADPTKIKELPDDPFFPNKGQRDYTEFVRRIQLLADQDIVIRVERGKDNPVTHDIKVKPMHRYDLGVRMHMGPIQGIRKGSPADGKLRGPDPDKKLDADLLEAVMVTDADGKELVFQDKKLDPERLPTQLKQWSTRLDKAKFKGDRIVTLKVKRHQAGAQQFATEEIKLKWDNDWQFDRVVALSRNSGIAIPELGFSYQIKAIVSEVTAKGESPFRKGDVIINVRDTVDFAKPVGDAKWRTKDIEEGGWAHVSFELFEGYGYRLTKLEVKVKRESEVIEFEVPLKVDETWALRDRGWILAADVRRVKAKDPMEAIAMGMHDTRNRMTEVFLNVRGMIFRRIDVDNMGGPLTIAYGTYRFASMPWGEFVFFLGLISINLAVVNFLPIPILDGGHMVFLIYEGIRRKPASESVRIWATYAGLALVLCLMIFVLSLDINRFFFN